MSTVNHQRAEASPLLCALGSSTRQLDSCVRYALVWIAHADGAFDERERRTVVEALPESPDAVSLQLIIDSVARRDHREATVVFGVLQRALSAEQRAILMSLLIDVVVADGRLAIGETHGLRFFGDLLGMPPPTLEALYSSQVAQSLAAPGDPSSRAWWEARTGRGQRAGSAGHRAQSDKRLLESLATLGLAPPATVEEIKTAYRRLAAVHHPDRFQTLGPSAVSAATRTFQRISSAYEYACAAVPA
jgi:DnaJ like chaperone protein